MNVLLYVGVCLFGFLLLYYGAEFLVRYASKLALLLGVSSLTVGLSVIAFGTSVPELAVSMMSRLAGYDDIVIGNVIGSNIANLALILGISAMIAPLVIDRRTIRFEMPFALTTAVILYGMGFDGKITRLEAVLLVIFLGAFIGYIYTTRKPTALSEINQIKTKRPKESVPFIIVMLAISLVLLPAGAKILIWGAVELAKLAGVSERVISLTLIALGTSLPELAVCTVAALRGRPNIALGNAVGSNIFNVVFVLGLSVLVKPVTFQRNFLRFDMPVLLAVSIIFVPFFVSGKRLSRAEGTFAFLLYCAYIAALVIGWKQLPV